MFASSDCSYKCVHSLLFVSYDTNLLLHGGFVKERFEAGERDLFPALVVLDQFVRDQVFDFHL